MKAHHHILIWLIVIYILLGVATFFLIGSSNYIDIVLWPKYVSNVTSSLGLGG